jgi:hypothetical protein
VEACKSYVGEDFWGHYHPHSLVAATQANDVGLLRDLIAKGRNPKSVEGEEALIVASRLGRTAIAEILLSHGAHAK